MKKENRKKAQQERALARKKREQRRKLKKFLSYFVPIVCVVLLAGVIIADAVRHPSASEKENTSSEATSENTETDDSSSAPVLSKDPSLTIAEGDTVNIDYVGSVDNVEFDGGSTNGAGADLKIGSHTYIDDFEEQLIGAHPGDAVEVHVTFPEDYGKEDLNGKDAVFQVTVNGIYTEN